MCSYGVIWCTRPHIYCSVTKAGKFPLLDYYATPMFLLERSWHTGSDFHSDFLSTIKIGSCALGIKKGLKLKLVIPNKVLL